MKAGEGASPAPGPGTRDLDGPAPVLAAGSARREEILDVAEALVESEGLDALTMRRLADAVGMRAPSLYKHVRDKAELEAALQSRALVAIGTSLRAAADGPRARGRAPVAALGAAYRAWALAHPGLYALATARPLDRERLEPGVEEWSAWPVVRAAGGDEDRARVLWAAAHGLVLLELAGRFPPRADVDRAWAVLADSLAP